MKIVLVTHKFAPDIGGIEAMSELLGNGFAASGHQVVVVTHSAGLVDREFPFRVVRRPGPVEQLRLTRWADVVFHNNICLQFAWPLILIRRPWVVAVRTWIRRTDGRLS